MDHAPLSSHRPAVFVWAKNGPWAWSIQHLMLEQHIYPHAPSSLTIVHCIPSLGLANAAMGFDVGGGNGNSHCLNASLLLINPSISATASIILCRSSFSNPCWGLAVKCAWI